MSVGTVSLVGAGPGDPELLTRRAHLRLAEADLVLYDALVSPAVLELAPRAQRFYVGKRAACRSIGQDTINRLMIRAARRGRRVVRLKAGDPFVFGRGGEEALALDAAGIQFEVVPGITSAIAAPALAGIPVTHRGKASAFVVVSGHAEAAWAPIVDTLPPGAATLVVLMGLASRTVLAARLLAHGWKPETAAAVLLAASHPEAATWIGTLGDVARGRPALDGEDAGTIVIGDVVDIGRQIGVGAQRSRGDERAAAASPERQLAVR